jgi:4-amino-4-deoxy-L-arabinose transferase-like glycosyltransferase
MSEHRQGTQSGTGGAERREPRRLGLLVLGVIAFALCLRVWGIGFGLPYDFTYDEVHEVVRAFKLGAGEYYWDAAGKGGLYYILFLEYGALYVVWWILGWVQSARDFAIEVIRDRTAVFLLGRLTVAAMGTLTCLAVYLIGRRERGWRTGLAAAVIGAAAYRHALHSHMINVDIGMTFALWTAIWLYLRYEDRGLRRDLVGAGVLAGVAVAFKLPGAIVALPLALAIVWRPEAPWELRRVVKEGAIVFSRWWEP